MRECIHFSSMSYLSYRFEILIAIKREYFWHISCEYFAKNSWGFLNYTICDENINAITNFSTSIISKLLCCFCLVLMGGYKWEENWEIWIWHGAERLLLAFIVSSVEKECWFCLFLKLNKKRGGDQLSQD